MAASDHVDHRRHVSVLEEIYQEDDPAASARSDRRRSQRRWRMAQPYRWVPAAVVPLTVLTLWIGVGQMRQTLHRPTAWLPEQPLPSLLDYAVAGVPLGVAAGQDTDGDGLSDADEQRYGTSAYLEDTDADGILDGAEVNQGSDPNCPAGQDCTASLPSGSASADEQPATGSLGLGGLPSLPTFPQPPLPSQLVSPERLRQELAASGVPSPLLDQFTDEELTALIQDVQAEQLGQTPGAAPASTAVPEPAALRQLLQDQGVSDEILGQYSDAELFDLYQQMVTEANGNPSGQ